MVAVAATDIVHVPSVARVATFLISPIHGYLSLLNVRPAASDSDYSATPGHRVPHVSYTFTAARVLFVIHHCLQEE